MRQKTPEEFVRFKKRGEPDYVDGWYTIPKAFNPVGDKELHVIVSTGMGWDHVSVSTKHRCPTWAEMKWVKQQFFQAHEWAIEYHPAMTEYIGSENDNYVLHIWRPQNLEIPIPSSRMV